MDAKQTQKLCPLLSAGKEKATRCQGERCAWYSPVPDGSDGDCGLMDGLHTLGAILEALYRHEQRRL